MKTLSEDAFASSNVIPISTAASSASSMIWSTSEVEEDCDEVEVEVEVEAVELLPPQADSPSDARAAEERRKKVLLFMIIHLTARKIYGIILL